MTTTQVSDSTTCPICESDTADTHNGICCAEHQTQWYCKACDAHLVGFAFPLGRCTSCSGELTTVQLATGPDQVTIEAVRHAMAIELGGVAFYTEAAEVATDPAVKELCLQLAGHERHHLEQLQANHHLPLETIAPDNALGLATVVVYGETQAPPSNTKEFLELAAELERRARDFFIDQRDCMPVGSQAREIYSHLAAEEAEHVEQVRKLLARQ